MIEAWKILREYRVTEKASNLIVVYFLKKLYHNTIYTKAKHGY